MTVIYYPLKSYHLNFYPLSILAEFDVFLRYNGIN